jgi:hypothetical protein
MLTGDLEHVVQRRRKDAGKQMPTKGRVFVRGKEMLPLIRMLLFLIHYCGLVGYFLSMRLASSQPCPLTATCSMRTGAMA